MTSSTEGERRPGLQISEEERVLGIDAKNVWDRVHKALVTVPEYNEALAKSIYIRSSKGLDPLGAPIKFGDDKGTYSVDLSTPGVTVLTSTFMQNDRRMVATSTVKLGEVNGFRFKGAKPYLHFRLEEEGKTVMTKEGSEAKRSILAMIRPPLLLRPTTPI